MKTINSNHPIFDPENKSIVIEQFAKLAEQLDSRLEHLVERFQAGFEPKERYKKQDWSEIANEIYEDLEVITDTPIGELVNGVIYGVTDQAIEVLSLIYDKVAERFGETLTEIMSDPETLNRTVYEIGKTIENELLDARENYPHKQIEQADPLLSIEHKPEVISPTDNVSVKDYLETIPPDYSEYIETEKGIER